MSESDSMVSLVIVIPMFNESEVILSSLAQIDQNVKTIENVVVLLVDDGSTDGCSEVAQNYEPKYFELRIVRFSQNQGHMAAITLGYKIASELGKYIVTMDADLQDPPELISEMYLLCVNENLDVVQAVRSKRSMDTWFKVLTAKLFYTTAQYLLPTHFTPNAADFRLVSKEVAIELISTKVSNRIYRFLIPSIGYRMGYVYFERPERVAGKTKYTKSKMVNLAVDSILSYSTRPLHIITLTGFILSAVMFFATISLVLASFFTHFVRGWASIVTLLLFTQGALIFSVGLVGEYIARIFEHTMQRPQHKWIEVFNSSLKQNNDE